MKNQAIVFRLTVLVRREGTDFHTKALGLKGVQACEASENKAVENIRTKAEEHLSCLIKNGLPIPVGEPDWRLHAVRAGQPTANYREVDVQVVVS